MLVDPSATVAGSTVTGAIRQASQATGTSFNYLLATAQVESGLNPQAGAPTSSARGLFQFIEQTWLGTIKQSGSDLGYGRYAAAITKTPSGHYQVTDPEMRSEILKLRNDPTANAVMAGAFTKANADILSKKLGRQPTEGELYIAHFLGAGGAARLISLAEANPGAKATTYFPTAANANSSIFFDRSTGTSRTLAQVRNVLTARYDVARARPGDGPHVAQATQAVKTPGAPLSLAPLTTARSVATAPLDLAALATPRAVTGEPLDLTALTTPRLAAAASPPAPSAPDTAGITSAYAAAMAPPVTAQKVAENQMFHGLFQDSDRTGPVAEVVSQLWTTPLGTPAGEVGKASHSGGMTELFRDTEEGT
jgi:hypothetical protein